MKPEAARAAFGPFGEQHQDTDAFFSAGATFACNFFFAIGGAPATFTTRWLRFVDDVEFALDAPAGVIDVRSASRLGAEDFGTNRRRIEAIRSAFDAGR